MGVVALPIATPLSLVDCTGGYCTSLNKRQMALHLVTFPLIFPVATGLHFAKESAYDGWHAWDSKE